MIHQTPLDPLAFSMFHALGVGLLPTLFSPPRRDRLGAVERAPIEIRPTQEEVEFQIFCQTWGSNSCGFPGLGGSAMARAYTVVALGPRGDACVYFNARPAYHVRSISESFAKDSASRCLASVSEAVDRYGATLF